MSEHLPARAALAESSGGLGVVDIQVRAPGPGEVRVNLRAAVVVDVGPGVTSVAAGVPRTYDLEDVTTAFADMLSGRNGKCVVEMSAL